MAVFSQWIKFYPIDTLSHALWGRGLFGYRGNPKLALFWGAFPDLLAFGPFFCLRLFTGKMGFTKPPVSIIPDYVFPLYDFSHSFITACIFIGLISFFRKEFAFFMLGWPFHILLDFPFHSIEYFPTKFIWPISDYTLDGIPWNQPAVWLPNLAGIGVLFLWRKFNPPKRWSLQPRQ